MKKAKGKIDVKLKRPKRLSDEAAEILRSKIGTGDFKPGERLPSEATLAESFGVSRTVIREALARLKSDGLLETRQGRGAIVSENRQRSAFRFESKIEGDVADLEHLFELRAILESGSASLAALRRDEKLLHEMEACLKQMNEAVLKDADGTTPDFEFHLLIAKATGNPDVIAFMEFLNSKLNDQIRKARENSRLKTGLPLIVEREHVAIFDAIAAGNPDAAREAVIAHIFQASQRLGLNILNRK